MGRRSSPQQDLPFDALPANAGKPGASMFAGSNPSVVPDKLLRAAIVDPGRTSGLLPLADAAVRFSPGDGHILLLAAVAALIDRDNARALKFLKRFAKRFILIDAYHLLSALALAQQNRLALARSVLESRGLGNPFAALLNFPGGEARRAWLYQEHDRIFERRKGRKRAASVPKKTTAREKAKPSASGRQSSPAPGASDQAFVATLPDLDPAGLPLIDIEIPISAEIDARAFVDRNAEPAGERRRLVRPARAPRPSRPRARLRRTALPAASARHRDRSGTRSRPCARCSSSFAAACCSPTRSGSARPSKPAWC